MSFDSRKFKRSIIKELKEKVLNKEVILTDNQIRSIAEKELKNRNKSKIHLKRLLEFLKGRPIRLKSRIRISEKEFKEVSVLLDIASDTVFEDKEDIVAYNVINKRFDGLKNYLHEFSFAEIGLTSIENYIFFKFKKQIDIEKYDTDIEYCQEVNIFVLVNYLLDTEFKSLDMIKEIYAFRLKRMKELEQIKEEV